VLHRSCQLTCFADTDEEQIEAAAEEDAEVAQDTADIEPVAPGKAYC